MRNEFMKLRNNGSAQFPDAIQQVRIEAGHRQLESHHPFWVATLSLALSLLAMSAPAANRYVRAGATGNGSGSDWNNAYTSLPATLVRGDTYYVADGNYPGYVFTTPASGTTFIYVKKATLDDHGTDTGWQASYGDGQAVFAPMRHNAANGGYIDLNGYSPHVAGNYGFKIDFDKTDYAFNFDRGGKEFKFRYVDFDGVASSGDVDFGGPPWTYTIRVLPWNGSSYDDTSGMLISHCALHGSATHIQDNSGNANIVIEYSDFYDCRSVGVDHGNIYWIGSSGGTFRYNRVWNWNVEGLLLGLNNTGWKIYGNLFYDGVNVARGIEFYGGRSHGGTLVYNNTFVNVPLAAIRVESSASCSGVQIMNNLTLSASISMENGGSGISSANNGTATSASFVNMAAKNFRLAKATQAGTTLPAPYNTDPEGRVRGQDGVWDLGAFEYGPGSAGGSTNPLIYVSPSALDFGPLAVGATTNLALTVRNLGAGTLSGTATVSAPFSVVSGASYNVVTGASHTVSVRFSPTAVGNHEQVITFTGGGGAVAAASGVGYIMLPGLSFAADAGVITTPFVASGGSVSQAVDTGVSDGGRAVYAFSITNAGEYLVQAIVDAPSASENSLFVNVDAEPTDPYMIWQIPITTGFQTLFVSWQGNGTWDQSEFAPKVFNLAAGNHQLIIRGREPNTRLQRISIVRKIGGPSNLRVASSQ